jgi:hypothetical protein
LRHQHAVRVVEKLDHRLSSEPADAVHKRFEKPRG